MLFYATVVTVYSVLFLVLMVQMPGSILTPDSIAAMTVSRTKPGWWLWIMGGIVAICYLTAGLVMPLAILAGFLGDATVWRILAFTATIVQIVIAGGTFLITAFVFGGKTGTVLQEMLQKEYSVNKSAENSPDSKSEGSGSAVS